MIWPEGSGMPEGSGIMKRISTMPRFPLTRQAPALVVLVLLLLLSTSGYAQTTTPAARQLLDSMITALGGPQFLDVKEIQTAGRYFTFRRDEISSSDLYAAYLKFPDMDRTELGKEKQKSIRINKGLEGWTITPGKGKDPEVKPQSASEAESFLKDFKTKFDYVVRFVVNTPKASILTTGSETVESRRTDVLEIRDADKNLTRIFVDRETRLPVKVQSRPAKEATVFDEVYANWHKFDGIMTPLMVIRYKDGVKTLEMRLDSASYNPGFPDSLFAPPVKTK
jgi:hypothetical protein